MGFQVDISARCHRSFINVFASRCLIRSVRENVYVLGLFVCARRVNGLMFVSSRCSFVPGVYGLWSNVHGVSLWVTHTLVYPRFSLVYTHFSY